MKKAKETVVEMPAEVELEIYDEENYENERVQTDIGVQPQADCVLKPPQATAAPKLDAHRALPQGWEERVDKASGRKYYIDHNTHKTHWELPRAHSAAPKLDAHRALPQGWEERVDKASGRKYYIDHNTRKTHWELPRAHSTNEELQREEENLERSKRCMNTFFKWCFGFMIIGICFWVIVIPEWWWMHVIKAILLVCLWVFVETYKKEATVHNYKCWQAILVLIGVIFTLAALCCCFDAESTVWRENDGQLHQVRMRDLALGDSVLAVNPFTSRAYFERIVAKSHFTYFDGGYQLNEMRSLVLRDNVSTITLSHTHFIYVSTTNTVEQSSPPMLKLARDVRIGDRLLYYNVSSGDMLALPVHNIETKVMRQKRAFFLTSPYVLVNNVIASPYMGSIVALNDWQHAVFSFVNQASPSTFVVQAFVTFFTIPFLVLHNLITFVFVSLKSVYSLCSLGY